MSVTVLAGATVVTMDPARRVLTDGAVAFSSTDGSILAVGPSAVVREQYPAAEVVDCAGSVVLPGFVNTHTHLFQTLLRGLGDDRVLSDWFTTMTGPSAVELTEDDRAADRTQDHQMQLDALAAADCREVRPRGSQRRMRRARQPGRHQRRRAGATQSRWVKATKVK